MAVLQAFFAIAKPVRYGYRSLGCNITIVLQICANFMKKQKEGKKYVE